MSGFINDPSSSTIVGNHSDALLFVDVHTAAMLSLVATTTTTDSVLEITADTIPETLLFDVHRLSLLQHEFNRIVCCATMLTIATHTIIGSDVAPSLEKQLLISDLVHIVFVSSSSNSNSSSEEVFDAIFKRCSEFSNDEDDVLTTIDAKDKLLKALSAGNNNEDDPVRLLM